MASIHPGYKEILIKRISCIVIWHTIILSVVIHFIACINSNKDASSWIISGLRNVVRPRFLIICVFQVFLSIICVITACVQYFTIAPSDKISRFRYLCRKISPNNIIWFSVFLLKGMLSTIIYVIAFKNFFVNSSDDNTSISYIPEYVIIVFSNALYINVIFFVYQFCSQKSFKYFSLVQYNNCLSMPMILSASKNASLKSLYYTIVYLLLYLTNGYSFCKLICYTFSINCNISYSTILSPFILYSIWLLNTIIFFNNLILKLLFDIYLISKVNFPVISSTDCKLISNFTLKDALAADNVPLVQYLAHYDLNIISQYDKSRRAQILSLSYPGGHAYTWQAISNEIFRLITNTINQLEELTRGKKENNDFKTFKYHDRLYFTSMRQLSPSHFIDNTKEKSEDNFVTKITSLIKNVGIISYYMEEMTDKQLECVLQRYQTLSLACYSLSNLAAASKTEDEYGVIQKDLPKIINLLLQLYVSLNKLVLVVNRKNDSSIHCIRKYLINATKSSLYNIAIHFGSHIKDLSLSPEDEKLFYNFILFKI